MQNINRVLRSADPVDPLNEAAGGVDTSFPILMPDRLVEFKIDSAKIGPSKTNPANRTLTLKFKTTKPVKLQDGKDQPAGFPVFKRYGITETEPSVGEDGVEKAGRTIDNIKRDLALILQASFGPKTTKTMRELVDNPSMLEGQIVQGKTFVEKGSGNFGPSTNFTFVLPA